MFYLADASGNSRGLLNGSGTTTDGYNWDAFGNLVSRFGSNPTMFAWNEASGYQTDNDDGLTLLGHRYYDKRTGRFISQDPAGDGDNWYGYADNDPMDETDPTGLFRSTDMSFGDIYNEASLEGGPGSEWNTTDSNGNVIDHFFVSNPDMGIGTPGSGINFDIDGNSYNRNRSDREHGQHVHQNGPNGPRYNREGQEVDGRDKPRNRGKDIPGRHRKKFREEFDKLFPPAPAGDDAQDVTPFTRWVANRSDADLAAISIGVAALAVGSYFIPGAPAALPVAGRALIPVLAP